MDDDEIIRAAKAKKGSPFLNTAQAAFYIVLSRRTLEKMGLTGASPRFRKHGRYVRYHIDDSTPGRSANVAGPLLKREAADEKAVRFRCRRRSFQTCADRLFKLRQSCAETRLECFGERGVDLVISRDYISAGVRRVCS
jgi:hypothetical protein